MDINFSDVELGRTLHQAELRLRRQERESVPKDPTAFQPFGFFRALRLLITVSFFLSFSVLYTVFAAEIIQEVWYD